MGINRVDTPPSRQTLNQAWELLGEKFRRLERINKQYITLCDKAETYENPPAELKEVLNEHYLDLKILIEEIVDDERELI